MEKNKKINNTSSSRRGFFSKLSKVLVGSAVAGSVANLFLSKKNIARAAVEPLLGSIALVPYSFAPAGWEFCQGQTLSISENTALYALLGATYGGNGTTTFALPDLRGRVPIGVGTGVSSTFSLGIGGGYESVTLTSSNLPSHTHSLAINTGSGTTDTPVGNVLAANAEGIKQFAETANSIAASSSIENTGSGAAHSNMQPYLPLNYIIATTGSYPSRS